MANVLTVMSFNIAHGLGSDGTVDLRRVADVIRGEGADVIGVQEVDRHFDGRSGFEDQAKRLAEELGMHYAYGANIDLDPDGSQGERRQYGTLTLSKFPIVSSRNHPLPVQPGNEPRGALETHLDISGQRLIFYNTHWGLNSQERAQQAERIVEFAGLVREPVVIVGDFNAKPETPEIGRMAGRWSDVLATLGHGGTPTYIGFKGKASKAARIDYIFASNGVRAVQGKVVPTAVSDHLAITAVIEIME